MQRLPDKNVARKTKHLNYVTSAETVNLPKCSNNKHWLGDGSGGGTVSGIGFKMLVFPNTFHKSWNDDIKPLRFVLLSSKVSLCTPSENASLVAAFVCEQLTRHRSLDLTESVGLENCPNVDPAALFMSTFNVHFSPCISKEWCLHKAPVASCASPTTNRVFLGSIYNSQIPLRNRFVLNLRRSFRGL